MHKELGGSRQWNFHIICLSHGFFRLNVNTPTLFFLALQNSIARKVKYEILNPPLRPSSHLFCLVACQCTLRKQEKVFLALLVLGFKVLFKFSTAIFVWFKIIVPALTYFPISITQPQEFQKRSQYFSPVQGIKFRFYFFQGKVIFILATSKSAAPSGIFDEYSALFSIKHLQNSSVLYKLNPVLSSWLGKATFSAEVVKHIQCELALHTAFLDYEISNFSSFLLPVPLVLFCYLNFKNCLFVSILTNNLNGSQILRKSSVNSPKSLSLLLFLLFSFAFKPS